MADRLDTADPVDATDVFADVARSLAEQEGLLPTLQRIVELAVETVPGVEQAAVTAVKARRQVSTVAATAEVVRRVDEVQYEVHDGPCLDAVFEQEVVKIDDLSGTDRWPAFSGRAVELGVRSMLAFRLFVEGGTAGALNLYSPEPDAFDDDSIRVGQIFAAHAALAWDHEKELEGLRTAVENRTLIGQAQGILMAQRGFGPAEAFEALRYASQHRNVKLRALAQEVVDTGRLSRS